ncbi:RidA family protein [Cryobacterium arcticum]|uniref:Enamine deaminase RidA n=1 Tax=Cryobacterium arcticum TaxID=670052 RepID=A0A317ZNG3_9MICO|nr:RidA family protein [Cryobacterium arcticum]PXA68001.1 enamine deaminase RidA [Cryobacterium arcticum]
MSQAESFIRSADLSDAAQYAYASTAPAEARLIFLAGACPLDLDGSLVGVGDYVAQAEKGMENLRVALTAAGAQLDDVVNIRVLVASSKQSDLVDAWAVVREAFGQRDRPSTLMGVTVLGYTDQLVEIEAVAAVIE